MLIQASLVRAMGRIGHIGHIRHAGLYLLILLILMNIMPEQALFQVVLSSYGDIDNPGMPGDTGTYSDRYWLRTRSLVRSGRLIWLI